jgi:choline-sulfatase
MWERLGDTQSAAAGASVLDADEGYAHQVAEAAIARIRQCHAAGERFLSWTSFDEPHPPFFAPPEFYADIDQAALPLPFTRPPDASPLPPSLARQQRRAWSRFNDWDHRRMRAGYYALVRYADDRIGRILDELDRLDLWRDTLVVFTADHGDNLGEHGLFFKSNFREGSVRVPLLVCHPDLTPGDRQTLVEHVDILPTVCDFLGVAPPPDGDGISLRPVLEAGDAAAEREIAISHLSTDLMLRDDRWKLVYADGEPSELFDMQADPCEFYNRLDEPAAAPARERLEAWLQARHPTLLADTRAALAAGRVRRHKRKPAIMLRDTD